MSSSFPYDHLEAPDAPEHVRRRRSGVLVILAAVGVTAAAVVVLSAAGGLPGEGQGQGTPDNIPTTQVKASWQGLGVSSAVVALQKNGPGCAGRADCSSNGDCINRECRCDAGYSGDKCEAGGDGRCAVRADCSDHGDCVNSECRCDEGFSGSRCEVGEGCTLQCQHGGAPDSECKACVCLGGWSGNACENWDDQYSLEALTEHIQTLSKAVEDEYEREMASDMPPLPAAIGTGVNRRNGKLGLPIVSLQYDRTVVQKQWTNGKGQTFVIAAETAFESTGGQNSDFFAMRNLDQLRAKNDEMRTANLGLAGVFGTWLTADNAAELYGEYLTAPDRAFYLYRESHPVFKMSLPLNKGTFRDYPLHPLALKGLNALPDTCESEEHKKMYQLFADTWGTSYTTSAVLGGLVEVAVRTRYCGVTDATVQGTIAEDKSMAFGATGSAAPGYAPWRDVVKSGLIGGVTEGVKDEATWLDSVHDAPAQIAFEYGAVADLITNPTKRACMQKQAAIEDGARATVPGAAAAAAQSAMEAYVGAKRSIHAKNTNCPNTGPPEQNIEIQGAQKVKLAGASCTKAGAQKPFVQQQLGWNVNLFCEQDGTGQLRAVAEGTKQEVGMRPGGFPRPYKNVPVSEAAGWVSTIPAGTAPQCSTTGYGQCCMVCAPLH